MNRRHFLLLTAMVLGLAGCPDGKKGTGTGSGGGDAASGDLYHIAVAGPMTGSAAAFGAAIKKGATLAETVINDAGGIKGKKIKISIEDDKGDPNEATNIAKRIVSNEKISVVVGHFNSSCTNAAKDTYNRSGLVEFSPGSTNVTICRGSDWTFRNLYHDDYQGQFIAYYVKNKLGCDKAAIAFENDDYGRGLKDAITAYAAEYGLEIVSEVNFMRERTQDFKPLATTLKEAAPQAVIIAGLYNEGLLLTKAIRNDLGWKDVKIIGGDGVMDDTFIDSAGDAAEGAYITTPFFLTADAPAIAQEFGKAYAAANGGESPNTWAALTYDAVMMAAKAIENAGADRKAIRDWFASCTSEEKAFVGVTGKTFFDEHGDCGKPAQVVVAKNGAFVLAEKQISGTEMNAKKDGK